MKNNLLFVTKILIVLMVTVFVVSVSNVYADDEIDPNNTGTDNTPEVSDAPKAPDSPSDDGSNDPSSEEGGNEEGSDDQNSDEKTDEDEESGDENVEPLLQAFAAPPQAQMKKPSPEDTRIDICHYPQGNPSNPQLLKDQPMSSWEDKGHSGHDHDFYDDEIEVCPPIVAESAPVSGGNLKVCKIIVDDEGVIITGNHTDAEFSIEITGPDDFYEEVTFSTELTLTDDLVDDNGDELDAQCVELNGLATGSYLYSEESIEDGRGVWGVPLYHDYYKEKPQSVDDFYELTVDGSDDDNDEADGSLSVTETNNRKVVVVNKLIDIPNPENSCLIPDADGDEDDDDLKGIGEKDLQDILDDLYGWLNKNDDQLQIQKWDCDADELVLNVKFIGAWAGNKSLFGYYTDSDLETFIPIFRTGNVDTDDNTVDKASAGDEFEINAGEVDSLGFAIKSWTGSLYNIFATENSLNPEGSDKVVAYNPEEDTYLLAFDDLLKSHIDHNDMVVEIGAVCRDIEDPEDKYPYGMITYPVIDYSIESGLTNFTAEYYDGDEFDSDNVQWAIRNGSCNPNTNTVLGNVDGHSDIASWDGQYFSFEYDLDLLEEGEYCFVFNPTDDEPKDVRETRIFIVKDSSNPGPIIIPQSNQCENELDDDGDGLMDYPEDPGCDSPTDNDESDESNEPNQPGPTILGGGSLGSYGAGFGEVLGATTDNSCGMYIYDYMRQGDQNNPFEVIKLQTFLNLRGYPVPVTGFFGPTTDQAVRDFQEQWKEQILEPWVLAGLSTDEDPTGYVYKTTRYTINNMICPGSEALPTLF